MSKDLKPALIRAFYFFMEMETEGYEIYVDTPGKRFKYSPKSIWVINSKTKKWILELENSGNLWYYYQLYNNFSNWFNEELSVFEQLITMWVEDVLKRGVSTTHFLSTPCGGWVEDVLKRGVSTTTATGRPVPAQVEDVLKRGVSTTRRMFFGRIWPVVDVLKRGVLTTHNGSEELRGQVEDVLKRGVSITYQTGEMWPLLVEDVLKRGVSTTNSTIAIRSIEVNDVLKRKTLKTKVYWWKKIINLYKSLTIRSNLS